MKLVLHHCSVKRELQNLAASHGSVCKEGVCVQEEYLHF